MRHGFYLSLVALIIGCATTEQENELDTIELENDRIKLVERTTIQGYYYYIIKVDSVEFLTNGKGGVYPLGNCN